MFMKYYQCLFLIVFFNSLSLFSQEKYKQHTVSKGETITEIAQKYKVKPTAIYELNPDAVNGIKSKMVLLIPTKTNKNATTSGSEIATKQTPKTHEVLPKETLYGIAKQFNVAIENLYKINPDLEKEGLKIGQVILIPQTPFEDLSLTPQADKSSEINKKNVSEKNNPKSEVVLGLKSEKKIALATEGIEYEVLPKESLYSVAKKYGITVAELKKANPELEIKSLKAGQKIVVPIKADSNLSSIVEKSVDKKAINTEKDLINNDKKPETEFSHQVLPKETKYGIAKQYGLTVAELEKQNPNIANKLLLGSVLKISTSKVMETPVSVAPVVVKANEKPENRDFSSNTNPVYDSAFVDQLISKASENIGTRYRSGGTTTEGFDCSGLMCYTFSSYDIKLPRSSIEMASYGSKVDAQSAQKGDLIFFKTRGSGRINHVGMVVEVLDGEIKFIHSASHGGVMISSTKESYYERNLVQVNRVL
jgi:cell wall-associated NlpC family hydrolase